MKNLLRKDLTGKQLRLAQLKPEYWADLQTACAADPDIWEIYPHSMLDAHFQPSVDAMLAHPNRIVFAVIALLEPGEKVVGMTSYINPDIHGVVEIGGTYIEPSMRGTGFNDAMKTLMIDHAFASGFRRIEFRVDTRNQRSAAAFGNWAHSLMARYERMLSPGQVMCATPMYSVFSRMSGAASTSPWTWPVHEKFL